MLFSSSVSVSKSETGNISFCETEVDSVSLGLRASTVARAVVRASTEFTFRYVSGADNFMGNDRGSSAANDAAAAAISTLFKCQTETRSKIYTSDFAQPD